MLYYIIITQSSFVLELLCCQSANCTQHVVIKKKIKLEIDRNFLHVIKDTTLNDENWKTFPLRVGTGQDVHSCHFYSILY